MNELVTSSRKKAGVLADGLVALFGAESVEARAATFRIAEVLNLIQQALSGK